MEPARKIDRKQAAAGCLSHGFLASPARASLINKERFGSLLVLAPSGLYLTSEVGCLLLHVGLSLTSKVMIMGPSHRYLRHGRDYLVELAMEVYPSKESF
ncbi:hypothetical protein ACQJBY_070786 [Aegilops geniculata]